MEDNPSPVLRPSDAGLRSEAQRQALTVSPRSAEKRAMRKAKRGNLRDPNGLCE